MTPDESALISETFCEVLESQALMFAEVVPEPTGPPLEAQLASIHFSGHFAGRLCLATSTATSHEMTANILGLDADEEAVAAGAPDALKEMLNVACGHVLTAIAGPTPVFDLSPPTVRALSAAEWDELAASGESVLLLIEDEPALLNLVIEK